MQKRVGATLLVSILIHGSPLFADFLFSLIWSSSLFRRSRRIRITSRKAKLFRNNMKIVQPNTTYVLPPKQKQKQKQNKTSGSD